MPTFGRSDFRHCSRSVSETSSNRRMRTRMSGGVGGAGLRGFPLSRSMAIVRPGKAYYRLF
jgi:hypothetical protein